jgi:uncharacterized caspase-like protein
MAAPAFAAETRVALVIGNAAYQNAPPLANPVNDAQDVSAALKRFGFEVIDGRDLDKREMERALARFGRLAQDADAALLYYAGHGMQYRGQNYLLPIDAKLEDDFSIQFETARVDDIVEVLGRARGVRILVLDACRNNPLVTRLAGTSRGVAIAPGLNRIERSQGLLIAYATQANQVAVDGRERNSPFTAAFVKEIEEPNVEIGQLFRRVAAKVNQQTRGAQTPELSISLLGEFYLNKAETDSEAWARIRQGADLEQLREFMARHPNSYLVEVAKAQIEAIERRRRQEARRAVEERLERERQSEAVRRAEAERATREREERERQALMQRRAEEQEAARRAEVEKAAREREEQERQGLGTQDQDAARQAEAEKAVREREEQERLAWQRLEAEQRRRAEELAARERALAEEKARLAAAAPAPPAATAQAPAPALARPLQVAAVPSPAATPEPSRSAAVTPAGPALVAAIQQELKRVGCFTGAVDRKWARTATSRAVKDFARHARLDPPDLPSAEFLDALKGKSARVCPMVCSPRQSLRNGTCVAKSCPKGERLDADGDCVELKKPKPKAKAKAPEPVETRRAQAARGRIIERKPVHEPVQAARPRRAAAAPAGGGGIRGCFVVSGLNFCQ